MRQMKERREPIHILMDDCCPSFFTVPVFRSRILPAQHRNTNTHSTSAGQEPRGHLLKKCPHRLSSLRLGQTEALLCRGYDPSSESPK
ncbi:hypothetical protein NHX12_006498 [Muraenolepis orangiensis]|uniref:Uncharacterized protein n=1 Tax=Muraenolepis orangiensis TaxID=630683 RepID=A0A9Q0DX57_9TELE|nr:hypothetical protein NHX12_006498 [Muraenolepis orangiensis]